MFMMATGHGPRPRKKGWEACFLLRFGLRRAHPAFSMGEA